MNTVAIQPSSPSLPSGISLVRLASILRFACVLGNSPEGSRRRVPDGEQGGLPGAGPVEPDFARAVVDLFQILAQRRVRYLLVGGVALLRYVPGRNTEDIDLLLAVEDLATLPEIVLSERADWFAKGVFQGLRVDFLLTANPLFRFVLERYATFLAFLEQTVPCASPEGLLLLKLYALPSLYRQRDLQKANLYEGDIAALLLAERPLMEPLFQVLSGHVSATDLSELRNIVAEAQERRKRFGEAQS